MTDPQPFVGYPSGAGTPWPGAWSYGVDFTASAARVIAVRMRGGDKHDTRWIGPIALNGETAELLEAWAVAALYDGGYVHLFPADGDALDELRKSVEESE